MHDIAMIIFGLGLAATVAFTVASALRLTLTWPRGRVGFRVTSAHGEPGLRVILVATVFLSTFLNVVAVAI